eukprot:scaffold18187_cov35-Cyclotella_meneghiniana.AAC.1
MHGVIQGLPEPSQIPRLFQGFRTKLLLWWIDVFNIVGPPRSRPQTGMGLQVSLPADQLLPLNLSNATTKVDDADGVHRRS